MENTIITLEQLVRKENGELLVSGRLLHKYLGVKRDFSNWMKQMIEYGFLENNDYFEFSPNLAKNTGKGRPKKEYALKMDMAKEICMVQRTEKGREARRYFIDCEKRLRAQEIESYKLEDPIERAKRWIVEQEERRRLQQHNQMLLAENQEMQPKAEYFDGMVERGDAFSIRDFSKAAGLRPLAETIPWLLYKGWLYRKQTQSGKKGDLLPAQEYVNRGYFVVKERSGETWSKPQVFITVTGQQKILEYKTEILAMYGKKPKESKPYVKPKMYVL